MKVWYDTEFWEQGNQHPIVPISYGFVREDGQELYLIDEAAPLAEIANQHDWLRENVLPHLPVHVERRPAGDYYVVEWDEDHPDIDAVVSPGRIRHMIEGFLTSTPDLELWAWYSAYDHVVLAQTFGTMSEMPKGIPYYTNDLRQLIPGDVRVPVRKAETEHDALADALWARQVHEWWEAQKSSPGGQSVTGSNVGGSVTQIHGVKGDLSL